MLGRRDRKNGNQAVGYFRSLDTGVGPSDALGSGLRARQTGAQHKFFAINILPLGS